MFATTADELMVVLRDELNDVAEPYLWSDALLYAHVTEAADTWAKRTHALYKIVVIAYLAEQVSINLPAYVLDIREARIVGGHTLHPVNANSASGGATDDYGFRAYRASPFDEAPGRSACFLRDFDRKAIRLLPRPAEAGSVELQCTVTLAAALEAGSPLPSTDAEDLRLLLHGAKAQAFRKQDAETEDLVRARDHAREFENGLLAREQRLRNYRRTPGVVRMEGW